MNAAAAGTSSASVSNRVRHHAARGRRPRNANPYDLSHQASPVVQSTSPVAVTPSFPPPETSAEWRGESQWALWQRANREAEAQGTPMIDDDTEDLEDMEDDDLEHGEIEGDDTEAILHELRGVDGDGAVDDVPMETEPQFHTEGLKEIGNLASWTVSTYKPGCGVEALRDEDTNLFWQSDGPQPHHLNIHFNRFAAILAIRIYLDFEADESYTPTRITFYGGTGYHDLTQFATLEFSSPKGWIDVPLHGVGGKLKGYPEYDGNVLRAFLLQVKVVENHQNGKDTHIRGLKIYAKDESVGGGATAAFEGLVGEAKASKREKSREGGRLIEPDWMGEPELR